MCKYIHKKIHDPVLWYLLELMAIIDAGTKKFSHSVNNYFYYYDESFWNLLPQIVCKMKVLDM